LSPAPTFDLEKEFQLHQVVKDLIEGEFINAAHDVSDGGLFVTLTEMGIPRGLGFDIETDMDIRTDAFLFGEGQGRVVVTLPEEKRDQFNHYLKNVSVPVVLLGHVTKGKMQVDLKPFGFMDEARDIYMNALGQKIDN
jgi:phosphoribosylformylglycinamidine synthase